MHTQPRTPQAVPYFQISVPLVQKSHNRPTKSDFLSARPPLIGLIIVVTANTAQNNRSHVMREPTGTDAVVTSAIDQIRKKMGATHIYLLGKRCTALTDSSSMYDLSGEEIRSDQYWLFAITKKEQGHHVPHIVKTLERKYTPVSLCIGTDTQKNLRKKIKKGDRFLKNVLYSAQQLHGTADAEQFHTPKEFSTIPDTEIQKMVGIRYRRAKNLMDTANTTMDDPLLELVTMAMAVEQLCLGLLYAVWQHTPTNGTLDQYMKLVSMCWPRIMDHYPKATRTDGQQLKILLNAKSHWQRCAPERHLNETHLHTLRTRTMEFMQDSKSFVDGIT